MGTDAPGEALGIGQLYRRSKNALAREFRGPLWVCGEIKSVREQRGNLYLSLVDPGDHEDGGDISIDVSCWAKRHALVKAELSRSGVTLNAGMVVRVQGLVSLSKFGKLQMELNALDTEALVGRQASEKRRLYETLQEEGLLQRNREQTMAAVPLRVGLISSEGSEGYNDFLGQLERSGIAFSVTFSHSAVQGPAAPASLSRSLLSLYKEPLDVIAVVRGGGGELDAFDKEPVARAIANCPMPVWTGIGHTGDRVVVDDLAHRAFITPTECGQALVQRVMSYLDTVEGHAIRLRRLSERALEHAGERLRIRERHCHSLVVANISSAEASLRDQAFQARRSAERDLALASAACAGYAKDLGRGPSIVHQDALSVLGRDQKALSAAVLRRISDAEANRALRQAQLSALDPVRQLRRGYSITRSSAGHIMSDTKLIKAGDTLVTELAAGVVSSIVEGLPTSSANSEDQ